MTFEDDVRLHNLYVSFSNERATLVLYIILQLAILEVKLSLSATKRLGKIRPFTRVDVQSNLFQY